MMASCTTYAEGYPYDNSVFLFPARPQTLEAMLRRRE